MCELYKQMFEDDYDDDDDDDDDSGTHGGGGGDDGPCDGDEMKGRQQRR